VNTDPNFKFSWKSAFVGIYIAILVMTLLASQSRPVEASIAPAPETQASGDAVTCTPRPWRYVYDNLIWTKLYPLAGYEVTIDYQTRSNGCVVYNYWRDCEVNWSLGWDVDITYCAHSRNAAGTVITYAVNYRACLISDNLPVCYSGYARRTVGVWGQRIKTWGDFL
jgi:hypothetical protein